MPAEKHELLEGFIQFANSDEHQLPEAFGVNAARLKTYTRIISKTKDWELSFQRNALGIDENSELRYDKVAGSLTIRCSEDLKTQIEAELNSSKVPTYDAKDNNLEFNPPLSLEGGVSKKFLNKSPSNPLLLSSPPVLKERPE